MMKTYRDKMKKRNKKQLFMWNDENNQVNDENIQKKNKKKTGNSSTITRSTTNLCSKKNISLQSVTKFLKKKTKSK